MGDPHLATTARLFFEMLLWLEGGEENGVKTRSSFPAAGPPAYNAPEPY
jgi:hypothetical protein